MEILFPVCSHSVPSVLVPSYVGLIKTFFQSSVQRYYHYWRQCVPSVFWSHLFLVFTAQVSQYVFLSLLRYIDLEKIHFVTGFPLQCLPEHWNLDFTLFFPSHQVIFCKNISFSAFSLSQLPTSWPISSITQLCILCCSGMPWVTCACHLSSCFFHKVKYKLICALQVSHAGNYIVSSALD